MLDWGLGSWGLFFCVCCNQCLVYVDWDWYIVFSGIGSACCLVLIDCFLLLGISLFFGIVRMLLSFGIGFAFVMVRLLLL